jgi:hypothetical protein
MNQTKTCRNCKYCSYSILDKQFDKCKRNTRTWSKGEITYCSIVKDYSPLYHSCTHNNLIHWEPRPSKKEQFFEFIALQREKIKRLDTILDEYWKKFINLIK